MFEQIENVNKVNDINVNEKNVNMIIQIMASAYLNKLNYKSMKEILKEKNVVAEPGILYNYHIVVIQTMMMEEFAAAGFDLAAEVSKHGETFGFGKLSNYESQILAVKVTNVDSILSLTEKSLANN